MLMVLALGGLALAVWALTRDESAPPPSAAVPAAPDQLAAFMRQVPSIIANERDPARLEQIAAWLESQGQAQTAAVVRQQAAMLRTAAAIAPGMVPGAAAPSPAAPGAPPSSPMAPIVDALERAAQAAPAAAERAIDWSAPPPPPSAPRAPGPLGVDPARVVAARAAAIAVRDNLRRSGSNPRAQRRHYNRALMQRFQSLAGLQPDGVYGGRTRSALQFFGVDNPPRAWESRTARYEPDMAVLSTPPPAEGSASGAARDELDDIDQHHGLDRQALAGDESDALMGEVVEAMADEQAAVRALAGAQGREHARHDEQEMR